MHGFDSASLENIRRWVRPDFERWLRPDWERYVHPAGREIALADDAKVFAAATQPGLYALAGHAGPIQFAVNVDPLESNTTPLDQETFEQLGCRLAGKPESPIDAERLELQERLQQTERPGAPRSIHGSGRAAPQLNSGVRA